MYKTRVGTFHEHICLTYELEPMSGAPLNELSVTYLGKDPRLELPKKLTLATVKPILKESGY